MKYESSKHKYFLFDVSPVATNHNTIDKGPVLGLYRVAQK